MKMLIVLLTGIFISLSLFWCKPGYGSSQFLRPANDSLFIRVSKVYPKYFQTKLGETWVPVMTNYLPYNNMTDIQIEEYFRRFSKNGGNTMRIWISTASLEVEDTREGVYNPEKFDRIDKILELSKKYNIRIKFTLQHIRSIMNPHPAQESWANSTALADKFTNINEYVNTDKGKTVYLNRVRELARRYKNNPQIFGWELWNEMDAVVDEDSWYRYTPPMIDSVKKLFPHHMVTQTLGSMHSAKAEQVYKKFAGILQNDFFSVHRYLDEGYKWNQYAIVKGAMDTLAYQAVHAALQLPQNLSRPVVVNEIGAVEADHAGPSELYEKDDKGILLHDMLFTPFFSGAAGPGAPWHWDTYLMKKNVWFQFQRFKNAIKNIDPAKEKFKPIQFESNGVRCYALKGTTQTIIWCRDTANNWKTELDQGIPAQNKNDFEFNLSKLGAEPYTSYHTYLPWEDDWTSSTPITEGTITLTKPFKRSVVIFLNRK